MYIHIYIENNCRTQYFSRMYIMEGYKLTYGKMDNIKYWIIVYEKCINSQTKNITADNTSKIQRASLLRGYMFKYYQTKILT